MIVCTSCKTSYNVLSHSHWGLGQFFGGGGGGGGGGWGGVVEIPGGEVKKRQSPDFRSPEVGIFDNVTILLELIMLMRCLKEYGGNAIFHLFALRFTKQLSLGNKICSNSS